MSSAAAAADGTSTYEALGFSASFNVEQLREDLGGTTCLTLLV